MLQAAFAAGLAAEGCDVVDLGVVPTPAVAWACARRGAAGAVISASHNPFGDNGIKLFAAGGRKLDDATQSLVDVDLAEVLSELDAPGPEGAQVGTITEDRSVAGDYAAWLSTTVHDDLLAGVRVVVDAANGAASAIAARPFEQLGAVVEVIAASPDGININDHCGATHPSSLAHAVRRSAADLGIALDGDADRCVAVDSQGRIVDGDRLLALCTLDRHRRGQLEPAAVVVTVMANLGFRRAMAEQGIEIVETPVGDRYVLEALDAGGYRLGGEQSGHVIFTDLATTGDGLLTALQALAAWKATGIADFGEAADAVMVRLPQALVNVPVADASVALAAMDPHVEEVRRRLGGTGRVVVRASGTEPLVRVMVEATTQAVADGTAEELAAHARTATELLR
jgi:phosphoglucosamine mutase